MRKLSSKQNALRILCAILAALLLIGIILTAIVPALADDVQPNAWILKRGCDSVLIQKQPFDQPYEYWRYLDNDPPCGAALALTGNQKGKWLEVICLYLPNHPVGWVKSNFVVTDEPQPCNKTATVTQFCHAHISIGGRATWEYYAGEQIEIYDMTDTYCTCRWGVIQTNCITFDGSVEVVRHDVEARRAKYGYSMDRLKRDHMINVVDVR